MNVVDNGRHGTLKKVKVKVPIASLHRSLTCSAVLGSVLISVYVAPTGNELQSAVTIHFIRPIWLVATPLPAFTLIPNYTAQCLVTEATQQLAQSCYLTVNIEPATFRSIVRHRITIIHHQATIKLRKIYVS